MFTHLFHISFHHIGVVQWAPELKDCCPDVPIILVGCKVDARSPDYLDGLYNKVTYTEGQSMAQKIGAFAFLECSAKENSGVQEVFQAATKAAYSKKKGANSVLESLKSSFSSLSFGGGGSAGARQKAKHKEEAVAAKAKLKEEIVAEKVRMKEIQAAQKADKARLKAEAHNVAQAAAARRKDIAAAEKAKKKAEAEAQRLLLEKADAAAAAAAAAARDAILSGKEPSEYLTLSPDIPAASPSSQQPSPSPVADSAYETLATAMAQKRPCPYTSAKGSCRRMFTAGSHVVFCKIHTCKKPGCNAKKSSAAQFCPTHVGKAPPLPPLPAAFAQPPSEPPAPAPAPTPASPLAQTFDASNPFGPPPPSSEGSIPAEEAVDTAGVAKIGAEIPNPIPGVEETPTLPLAATLAAARVSFPLF